MRITLGLLLLMMGLMVWPGAGLTCDKIQFSVEQLEVGLQPEKIDRAEWGWHAQTSRVTVRVDTSQLSGRTWRLWAQLRPVSPAQQNLIPASAVKWETQPPFISGSLTHTGRVLVGEGPVTGQVVQGQLAFWARGEAKAAGIYSFPVEFILEVLP